MSLGSTIIIIFLFIGSVLLLTIFNEYDDNKLSYISQLSRKFQQTADLPFSTCLLPKYDPWNEEQLKFYNPRYGFRYGCNESFVHTELTKGAIKTKRKNTKCWSSCLSWVSDYATSYGEWKPAGTRMDCDVVAARCGRSTNISEYNYEMLHTQIVEKKDPTKKSGKNKKTDVRRPNVIVMIIDSISMGQAERVFPKSLSYMRQHLKSFSFPHFTKVAINSYPNAMPLLIGAVAETVKRGILGMPNITPAYIAEATKNPENTSSLYKWFKEKGYKTYLAENYNLPIFAWPNKRGFKKQPTDHIMNQYHRLASKAKPPLSASLSSSNCFISYEAILKHLGQFVEAYKDKPHFSFIWDSALGHDYINQPIIGDTLLLEFLIQHRQEIDNSFFVFMADHGLRFGKSASTKSGIHENNGPMLTISLPSYLRNNSELMGTLKKNTENIQTMWDVRATLNDILERSNSTSSGWSDVSPSAPFETGFGSSLFREQTGIRNCRTLPIPLAYCPCHYEKRTLNSTSEDSKRLGRAVIQEINDMMERRGIGDKCHKWQFNKVKFIEVIEGENIYYMVVETNKTRPAVFKMLLHESPTSGFTFETPDRQDKYGKRGDCAGPNSPFCECKK